MANIEDIIKNFDINNIIVNFISYNDFFKFILLFYKKIDKKYITLMIHNQLLLKNKHTIINNNFISFNNVPQNILNQIVLNMNSELVLILHKCKISFKDVPQNLLYQVIMKYNEIRSSTTIAYLHQNGVSFNDFSQEQLNNFVANGDPNTLAAFHALNISVGNLPQDILEHIKMASDRINMMRCWFLEEMGYYLS